MILRVIHVVDEDGNRWAFLYFVMPELEPGITFELVPPDCGDIEELPV